MRILVTGASGYVGRQLVPALLARGHAVRALSRDATRAAARLPAGVDVVQGDVLDRESLAPALDGIEVAYYLVHSMEGDSFDFEERDRRAAILFSAAARAAGVARIIYLGGLGDDRGNLSAHLRSRQEVGALLAGAGIPVTEFRAAIILGPGGSSFEMLRELTERLPVMICPRWVVSPVQPIALADVLGYLTHCLDVPASSGRVLEIGGPDVLTFPEMMQRFARVRGVHRWIVRVPVLTPRLSSYWVELVTSVPAAVARPLIEGLRSAVVVRDPVARSLLPLALTQFDAAVRRALNEEPDEAGKLMPDWLAGVPARLRGVLRQRFWSPVVSDEQVAETDASPLAIYSAIAAIGGRNGWYYWNWAWRLRGLVDSLLGGPGVDRRTPLPERFITGARRDFWDVLEVEQDRRVRLRALMRAPGTAELEWTIAPRRDGGARLYQTARFRPTGLAGRAYWYLLYPAHAFIFRGMVRAIVQRAGRLPRRASTQVGSTPS